MANNARVLELLGELLGAEDLVTRMNDEKLLKEGTDALAAVTWPDFEFALIGPDPAFRAEFKGVEGFVEGWHDWLSAFDSYAMDVHEVIGTGDGFVGLARMKATPKGTGAVIEQEAAAALLFEDGKLRRMEFHLDRGEAMRAAGLDPADLQG